MIDSTSAPVPQGGGAPTPGEVKTSGQQAVSDLLVRLDAARTTDAVLNATPYQSLRFFHGMGWHVWDEMRWAIDKTGEHRRRLVQVMTKFRKSTDALDKERIQIIRAAESDAGQRGALAIASFDQHFAYKAEDMDAQTLVLNVRNGVLDLVTFELEPHDRELNLTKVTNAAYYTEIDPDSMEAAEWQEFLERVLPDPEVRAYLQRYIGLALLGEVREHILLIATGTGANGKSTFVEAVAHALGDYAHNAEASLFMKAKTNANAASPAILALRGARFVIASETEKDAPLAVALMKNLTGGDSITTRGLFKDPITFQPSHTGMMVTNHKPKVPSGDAALWRRLTIVDFNVVIPEDERDSELGNRLKLSSEAILAWAVEGLRDYYAQGTKGLNPPESVRHSTQKYREESDDLAKFITDNFDLNPNGKELKSDIWQRWTTFATDEAIPHGTQSQLWEQLRDHGFTEKRMGNGRGMAGLTLTRNIDTQQDDEGVFVD